MKRILLTLFTAFSLLFLTNCSKDDDDDDVNQPPALTKEALAGNYKLIAVTGKTNVIPETDITDDYLEPCEKDDIITLKTDATYSYKDEGTKCSTPGDSNGAWAVTGNTIIIGPLELTVIKWDGKELHGTMTEEIEVSPGVTQMATLTFKFARQ